MLRRDRRGGVAVEFAIVGSLFLLPLFAGCADAVVLISAQAQVNTALQSVYYFAYNNPALAANYADIAAIVAKISAQSTHAISFAPLSANGMANPALSTSCIATGGAMTAPPCGSGQTQEIFVAYQITGMVSLPVPLPSFGSNPVLMASGRVQIAAVVQ